MKKGKWSYDEGTFNNNYFKLQCFNTKFDKIAHRCNIWQKKQNRNVLEERLQNILNLQNCFFIIFECFSFKLCFENVLKHWKISVGLFFVTFFILYACSVLKKHFLTLFYQNLMLECFLLMFWKHLKFINL